MQDKLLFAAGLVALFIGLFVGVRSDNVRKTAEENLANVSQQVVSVEQQLKAAEDRNRVIADKLGGMEKKLGVARDKLAIADNWYANLQKTNATLANDIYSIRLAMVEILADLKAAPSAAGQAAISAKIDKLVKMLDEHNAATAASAGRSASKEAAAAPEQYPAAEAETKGADAKVESGAEKTEKAPAPATSEKENETSAAAGGPEKTMPAEKMKKNGTAAPQASTPAEKQQNTIPAPGQEEKKEGAVRL